MAVRSSTPSAVALYCTFRAIFPAPRAPHARSRTRLHAISRCALSRCRSLSSSVCRTDISACSTPPQHRSAEASRHLAVQAFTTVVVYYVQYPIASLVLQNVVHKVHTPSFVYALNTRSRVQALEAFVCSWSPFRRILPSSGRDESLTPYLRSVSETLFDTSAFLGICVICSSVYFLRLLPI